MMVSAREELICQNIGLMWRRLLRGSHARSGLTLVASVPFAFAVHNHATRPVEGERIAENERFQKRWTIEPSTTNTVNRVSINVPGLTYVTAKESNLDSMGSVRVSGDSAELVDCVDVRPLPPNGLELRWKSEACAELRGHLLTTLALGREEQVHDLQTRGNGTVVVEDGVLLSDCEYAMVRIESEGNGHLFVDHQRPTKLDKLQLATYGEGTLQYIGTKDMMVRDRVFVEVIGGGKIQAFVGSLEAPFLKTMIVSMGKVDVHSSHGINVDKLKTSIFGTGNVVYDGQGECRVQRCMIVGTGDVQARDIHCETASIETYGDADVTWNIRDKIEAKGWSKANVHYVDEAPKIIEGKSMSLEPASSETPESKQRVEPTTAPLPQAAFNEIEAKYDSNWKRLRVPRRDT